jgi:hypothetical protein
MLNCSLGQVELSSNFRQSPTPFLRQELWTVTTNKTPQLAKKWHSGSSFIWRPQWGEDADKITSL